MPRRTDLIERFFEAIPATVEEYRDHLSQILWALPLDMLEEHVTESLEWEEEDDGT